MSEKVYVRVTNGPIQVGNEVVATKGYAHIAKVEADALAATGYAKIVGDAEGEKALKAAKAATKAETEATEPEAPKGGKK